MAQQDKLRSVERHVLEFYSARYFEFVRQKFYLTQIAWAVQLQGERLGKLAKLSGRPSAKLDLARVVAR
jgi:hypothetical protein